MLFILFAVVIFLILTYAMGETLTINFPDLSWNKLQLMQEQTRQLEIVEQNNTARWALVAQTIKYGLGMVALIVAYKFSDKLITFYTRKEALSALKYKALPVPNQMIFDRFGEEAYDNLVQYVDRENGEIVLYQNRPAVRYGNNEYHIIDL